MKHLPLFMVLAFVVQQVTSTTEIQPDMVVEIFRHGARGPSDTKYDPSWPTHGELTATGMRQLYILGSAIAKKYPNLLSEYDPRYIFIRSSSYNRTIMSAASHLYGVFKGKGPSIPAEIDINLTMPPFEDKELIDSINADLENVQESIPSGFQPLVTQVVNKVDDRWLFVGPWNCAQAGVWQAARLTDDLNKEVYEYLKDTITQLNGLGYKISSMLDLLLFGDTLIDNHYDKRALPKGIEYGSTLYNDAVFAFKWYSTYNFVGVGLERVIKSLSVLDQIVQWFKGAANKTNPLKYSFLSAHDTTLLPLLGLYKITNASCLFENYKSEKLGKPVPYPECVYPMFASQIIYEFYNRPEGPYIKFLYNGKPHKICKGDKFECSLEDFATQTREILMNQVSQDFKKLCEIPVSTPENVDTSKPKDRGLIFWYIFVIVALVGVIVGLGYLVIKQRKQLEEQTGEHGYYENKDKEMKEIILIKTAGV